MINRKVVLLLVIVGLVVGGVGKVPVARATVYNESFTGAMYGNVINNSPYDTVGFIANGLQTTWTGCRMNFATWYGFLGTFTTDSSFAFYVDGVLDTGCGATVDFVWSGSPVPYVVSNMRCRFTPLSGSHSYSWQVSGSVVWSGNRENCSWTASVAGYDASVWGLGGEDPQSEAGAGVWPGEGPPLSVVVSGATVVATDVGGTWTGTGSGGTSPYTYKWAYGVIGPFWTYPYSGSTFTKILPEGEWTIQCQVTDAEGDTATDDIVVVSTPSIGDGYRYVLQRSGAVGQVMDVWVYDSTTGLAAPIDSTADTMIGVYADLDPPNPKSFGWYDNASEASAGTGYAFRWGLNITVGGASSPPAQDMWFKSTITLVDDTEMTVVHHFLGTSEVVTGWTDPDGVPIAPEVPPPEESVLPDWLQALLDFLYVLLAPIIFVFEVIKALVTWIVGMLGYIVYAVGIVIAFGALAATWLGTIIATVLNFATAAPGAYVSIGGIMTLAGVSSTGVPGDTSVFAGVGFTASSVDTGLAAIHAWMMQSSMAWIWWAIFTFLLIGLVLNMGSKDSEDE